VLVRNQPDVCEPVWVNAEHPLFILYTSGSTGKPKGVQHSQRRFTCCQAILTMKWTFDYKQSMSFGVPRCGLGDWTHLYSLRTACGRRDRDRVRRRARLSGRRTLLENDPGPRRDRVLHRATAIRSLIKAGADQPKKYNLSTCGCSHSGRTDQPGSVDVVHTTVGKQPLPIVDTWWQTETGAHNDHAAAGRDAA